MMVMMIIIITIMTMIKIIIDEDTVKKRNLCYLDDLQ